MGVTALWGITGYKQFLLSLTISSLLKARSLKRQRHSEQGSFSRHKLLDQPIDPRTVLDVGTATGTRQKHHHNVTWQETDTALLYHWGAVRKEERRDIKEEKCKHF